MQGGDDGDWHCQMVQPDEGLRIHSAPGRGQRRLRPYLRRGTRRPYVSQRGSIGRIRDRQQSRQRVSGESQSSLTTLTASRPPTKAATARLENICRYSFATTMSIKL